MRKRIGVPSPAMVVALVALLTALAGGAYAAEKAAKNSVVSKSIKNGQVKSADLANGGVKAVDLGAGSVGAEKIAAAAVGTGALADGSVGAAKLADGAVGASKLGDGSVGAAKLSPGAVGTGAVADGAVTAAKLAPGSVGAGAIAAGAVGPDEIEESAVGSTQLGEIVRVLAKSIATGDTDGTTNGGSVGIAKAVVACPPGTRLISGGSRWTDASAAVLDSALYIQQESASVSTWEVEGVVDIGAQGTVRLQAEAYCLAPGGPVS